MARFGSRQRISLECAHEKALPQAASPRTSTPQDASFKTLPRQVDPYTKHSGSKHVSGEHGKYLPSEDGKSQGFPFSSFTPDYVLQLRDRARNPTPTAKRRSCCGGGKTVYCLFHILGLFSSSAFGRVNFYISTTKQTRALGLSLFCAVLLCKVSKDLSFHHPHFLRQ